MARKRKRTEPRRRIDPNLVASAMLHRVVQRIACAGSIKLPAVPSMLDWYLDLCRGVFAASGRGFAQEELALARRLLGECLSSAFARSNRSKIEIQFEADSGRPLGFSVNEDQRSLSDAYERWIGTSDAPLFGAHPDARVLSLVDGLPESESRPILDFGAGTGRNALALARRGHPVDAVEITPKFAALLRESAATEALALRVVTHDVFRDRTSLRNDYWMLLASEVVPDFRSPEDLRRLFELANAVLAPGGQLVFNVHVCALGFTPERAARELAQQCYSCLFTPSEIAQATRGLALVLTANDSVRDFERSHLPAEAWPPTPWYVNWTSGRDVYEVEAEDCPVEMRWLVFEKRLSQDAAPEIEADRLAPFDGSRRSKIDTTGLRRALERRLLKRTSASGMLSVPAVPALSVTYAKMCEELFSGLGRRLEAPQLQAFGNDLERMLDAAFVRSPRSNLVITYESPIGQDLHYTLTADPVAVSAAYEQWHESLRESLFGEQPDARLKSWADTLPEPRACRVLDLGAGLGRNALWLARRGFEVDALELSSRFVEALRTQAEGESLPLRSMHGNALELGPELRPGYGLVLASGMAGDLRDVGELQRIFELVARCLAPNGYFLLNVHVTLADYAPSDFARQWAQQCCATLYTPEEIERCTNQLPLLLEADDSALEYEHSHSTTQAWPPYPAFVEWASGLHLAALDRHQSPCELKWLLYRRT